jgi:hypothetical protein
MQPCREKTSSRRYFLRHSLRYFYVTPTGASSSSTATSNETKPSNISFREMKKYGL